MEDSVETKKEDNTKSYGKRPFWQWLAVYAVLGILIYAAAYYFLNTNTASDQSREEINESSSMQKKENQPPADTSISKSGQEFTIEGADYSFTPNTLNVKVGQPIKITFKNTGSHPHNFVVPDLSVKTATIQPGEEDTVTFTPSQKGSFTIDCTLPGHADRGMTGTLNVE